MLGALGPQELGLDSLPEGLLNFAKPGSERGGRLGLAPADSSRWNPRPWCFWCPPSELAVWQAARKGHKQTGLNENRGPKSAWLPRLSWGSVRSTHMALARHKPRDCHDRGRRNLPSTAFKLSFPKTGFSGQTDTRHRRMLLGESRDARATAAHQRLLSCAEFRRPHLRSSWEVPAKGFRRQHHTAHRVLCHHHPRTPGGWPRASLCHAVPVFPRPGPPKQVREV